MNQVLRRVESLLRRLIGEDINFVMSLATPLRRVRGRSWTNQQIIMNLAVNARDAMPIGGALTIETANLDLDLDFVNRHRGSAIGPHVMIAVSDTGSGMSGETLQHLFEPFFTTKPIGHGTGLGLSTVYGIVKQSRGAISVYSEVGQGSTLNSTCQRSLPDVSNALTLRPRRAPRLVRKQSWWSRTETTSDDSLLRRSIATGIVCTKRRLKPTRLPR